VLTACGDAEMNDAYQVPNVEAVLVALRMGTTAVKFAHKDGAGTVC
jgi:hypothetical protein